MGRLRYILYVVAAAVAASVAVGCSNSGCMENRSSVPLAGFYSYETKAAIGLDSLEIYGIGAPGDSILSEPGTTISQIYLPMRSQSDTVSWVIAYRWKGLTNYRLNDTLSFGYSAVPYFASEECGVIYRYSVRSMRYTTHVIDSVALTDSMITNVDTERIRIYFRTESKQ